MRGEARGITIIELLVVLAIIGLLATIAYSAYSGHVLRARIVATAAQIHELELACTQYEVDTGHYPPGGTGTRLAPGPIDQIAYGLEGGIGCGWMVTALLASLNGNMYDPIDPHWKGPYIELQQSRLGTIYGQPLDPTRPLLLPQVQLLDAWGVPYYYVPSADYDMLKGKGTLVPPGPFAPEIWYNPSTIQIVSFGPNMVSFPRPQLGLDADDITNFRY